MTTGYYRNILRDITGYTPEYDGISGNSIAVKAGIIKG
jgi:hypothetical protein